MGELTATTQHTLVVFDFDRTLLCDHDSDHYVVSRLCPDINLRKLYLEHGRWTDTMNKAIATFWSRGIRREKLLEAIRELRLPDAMTRTLEYLKSRGCKIAIVSDANELWIKEVLSVSSALHLVDEIHTNFFVWPTHEHDPAPCVIPFHNDCEPHNCPNGCPLNLCKGNVLLMLKQDYQRVIYVGDGSNDYCAAVKAMGTYATISDIIYVRLHVENRKDIVYARSGYMLLKKLQRNIDQVQCRIKTWDTPQSLEFALRNEITYRSL